MVIAGRVQYFWGGYKDTKTDVKAMKTKIDSGRGKEVKIPTKSFVFAWAVALLAISSVQAEEITSPSWTLETGVRLRKVEQCAKGAEKQRIVVSGTPREYLVNVNAVFCCGGKLKNPWLNLPHDGKASLVLDTEQARGFSSSCECFKSLTIGISGRLARGDVLYVVNGQEVVGHVVLP